MIHLLVKCSGVAIDDRIQQAPELGCHSSPECCCCCCCCCHTHGCT